MELIVCQYFYRDSLSIFSARIWYFCSIFFEQFVPLKKKQTFIVNIDRNSIWNERRSSHKYI